MITFLLGRYFSRDMVESNLFSRFAKMRHFDTNLAKHGFTAVPLPFATMQSAKDLLKPELIAVGLVGGGLIAFATVMLARRHSPLLS